MDMEIHDILATYCAYTTDQVQIYANAQDLAAAVVSYLEHLRSQAKHCDDEHAEANEANYDLAREYLQDYLPKNWW
jgi:hypothetical protein